MMECFFLKDPRELSDNRYHVQRIAKKLEQTMKKEDGMEEANNHLQQDGGDWGPRENVP